MYVDVKYFVKLINVFIPRRFHQIAVAKLKIYSNQKIFRQMKYLLISYYKCCFHEIFAKKVRERVNFCNFHTVPTLPVEM